MTDYGTHFSTKVTPQSEAIPGKDMVQNSAGGFSFEVDKWTRLERFLILGSEGGSYYASEKELTVDNAKSALDAIAEDGLRVVNTVVEISEQGRAHKNDPALFILALAAGKGDDATRAAALAALPKVARIGTHLFTFLNYVQGFRGWGRGLRKAVANWYLEKDADQLAYQMAKYRQRSGWTQGDALRKAHPTPSSEQQAHAALFAWATNGNVGQLPLPSLIPAFEQLQNAQDADKVIDLVTNTNGLTWEMIPTQFLGEAKVWEALLPNLPLTALLRNLGRMSANGLLTFGSDATKIVTDKLSNAEAISKARIHPISVLAALLTYKNGRGTRGSLTWDPVSKVTDALDGAFYTSFGNVEPTGKRRMLALDVSGSMGMYTISGIPGLTPRDASAALALVSAATEDEYIIVGFTSSTRGLWGRDRRAQQSDEGLSVLNISHKQRLDDAIRTVSGLPFGGTDCALPMLYANNKGMSIDSFEVYTDNETWAGHIQPVQALQQYRDKTGINAKLTVVGMIANNFSIADPNDPGMLDVVGFDTATPNVISSFVSS